MTTDTTHSGFCIQQGGSTFGTAVTGITFASSFIAKAAVDDIRNASDGLNGAAPGTALYGDITDWTSFSNSYRGWGRDGGAFPDGLNRVRCSTGTCRIWDWSLLASDTVLKSVLAPPTGSDIVTIRWYSAFTPANQTDGNTTRPGSIFSTVLGNHCESIFLLNAVELLSDGIGNDNGLCESGETCLYTPNIGAYQGHGNLVTAGPFTDGTVTSVTLLQYDSNGY